MASLLQSASDLARNLFARIQQTTQPLQQAVSNAVAQPAQTPLRFKTNGLVSQQVTPRIINMPAPIPLLPMRPPTIGQVGQGIVQAAQAVPRSFIEAKQTPVLRNFIPGAPLPSTPLQPKGFVGKLLLGNTPLQSFTDVNRPAGQFLKGVGASPTAVKFGTPLLAGIGAVASDLPGGAGTKFDINLARANIAKLTTKTDLAAFAKNATGDIHKFAYVENLPSKIASQFGAGTKTVINEAQLQHIQKRPSLFPDVVKNLPDIIKNPDQVVANPRRANSFILIKQNGRNYGVAVEIDKVGNYNFIRTVQPIPPRTIKSYLKQSGGTATSPAISEINQTRQSGRIISGLPTTSKIPNLEGSALPQEATVPLRPSLKPENPSGSGIKSIIPQPVKSTKTIGQLQEATQSPDLTAYEKAFNSGDTKTLDALAAKNPGDTRFQVHKQLGAPSANVSQDTQKYLDELAGKQKAAGSSGPTSLLQKGKGFLANLKTQLVDSASPIEDAVNLAEKKGGYQIKPTSDIRLQIDRVLRSKSLASQFAQDHGLTDVIKQAPDLHALDQYMIAKQASRVGELGIQTGRDATKDAKLVSDLAPTYEPLAKQVNQYSQKLLDYSTKSGLISKELATGLKQKYPDYVPLNRIFNELEQNGYQGATKSIANLSQQTVVQKLKGSTREIQSPIESLLLKTQTAFQQGEKNQAARMLAGYKDFPGNPLSITPLRTAENVNKRIDLYSQAKDLKPIQNKLQTFIQTHSGQLRRLQSQVNQLENKGLSVSLKQKTRQMQEPLTSAIRTKTTPQTIKFNSNDVVVGGKPQEKTLSDIAATSTNRGEQSTKKFIDDLITEPNRDIQALKRQVATRENKLGPLLDEIQLMRDSLEGVKAQRGNLFDEARALRDAESRGKSTFSTLNNGVREVYETTPEIASAAKNLNAQQMNIVTKILSYPTRALQLGATSLNVPFTATNLLKDQIDTFINSNRAAKTSILNPSNFLQALFAATKHNDLFKEANRNAAISTSFDIARDAPDLAVNKIRASRSVGTQIAYTARHPAELLRDLENLIGRSEELTRVQNYKGQYQALIKEGRTPEDARLLAAQAARTNTANFARHGDLGKVINYVIPFFNASIQGSRTFVNAAKDRPIQTGAKLTAGLFLPIAATTLYSLTDPQRKAVYDDISQSDKEKNIIIIPQDATKDANGKYNVIKIPIPTGLAPLTNIVRRGIEQTQGGNPIAAKEVLDALIGAATPFDTSSATKLIGGVTPQAIKPSVEAVTNTNLYTGNKIVPDSMKNLPPGDQVKPNTSPLAIGIGKITGLSPLIVEDAFNTGLGGVGGQILGKNPIQQLQTRFTQATGNDQQNQQFNTVQKYQQGQAGDTLKHQQAITKVVTLLTDPSVDKAKKIQLLSALGSNKTIMGEVKLALADKANNVTAADRAIRNLSLKQRAAYIKNQLQPLSKEQKRALAIQYIKKGILDANVVKEIAHPTQ